MHYGIKISTSILWLIIDGTDTIHICMYVILLDIIVLLYFFMMQGPYAKQQIYADQGYPG